MATLFGAIIAVVLVIYAVGQQTDYYFDPTAISQGKAPEDTRIRAGGMVVRGSVERDSTDPLNVKFKIIQRMARNVKAGYFFFTF